MSTSYTVYSAVTVTAQGQFSAEAEVTGIFGVIIYGSFTATITIQMSVDGTNWVDMSNYTTPQGDTGTLPYKTPTKVRIGCKTGGFTTGTATCIIYQ